MKLIQQDDIQDYLNDKTKKKFWFIHLPSQKLVRATNKGQANNQFRLVHKIMSERKDVRQANAFETMSIRK
jgi:hypothetical protein